ncbi:MAG: acetoacetate--CoA ligase, partial [Gemmatimonadota bacterium]
MTAPDLPLWTPSREAAAESALARFCWTVSAVDPTAPEASAPYEAWHAWSVREPERFWAQVWRLTGVIAAPRGEGPGAPPPWETVLVDGDRMAPPHGAGGPHWFRGARLNFAENLLRRRDGATASVAREEPGR